MLIPTETLTIILLVPVVATVITFFHQVIGIRSFGIYTPLVVTFAFLTTGPLLGFSIFLIVILAGTLTRIAIQKLQLLYLPRMAIVISTVAIVTLLILSGVDQLGLANRLTIVSALPIIMIISLLEQFTSTQISKSTRKAILGSTGTLIIAFTAFFIASWPWLQNLLLRQPAWLLLTLVINVFLGNWSGLRLTEYLRFREVIKHAEDHQE